MTEQVTKGAIAQLPLIIKNASGARVAPDSAPSILHSFVNGTKATIASAAITQLQDSVPANITGLYMLAVPTTALAIGDQVDVIVQATIGGFVTEKFLSFTVVASGGGTPYIDA